MKKGVIRAALAYFMWGVFPLFFHALRDVPSIQVLAHRIYWSFLLVTLILVIKRGIPSFKASVTWRVAGIYLVAAVLLAANWFTYVWAVANGYVVETSLGYYINPLVSVLLGVVLLNERLRPFQLLPILMALIGVIYLALLYGAVPWIALILAFSFGLYGLVKKISPLNALHGMALETALLFPPAAIYLVFLQANGQASFGTAPLWTTLMLSLCGVVTIVPLLAFSYGARSIPLVVLGMLQYIAPTMQFILGVFVFGEPLSSARLIGFLIIWTSLIIYSIEAWLNYRKLRFFQTAQVQLVNSQK